MKFSEIWLREWINPPINNVELIQQLTMIGFKADVSQPISNIFYGIVIGKIIECKTHPYHNNAWMIKVNNGKKKLLNIICYATNCRNNIKVVVATIGAILPNGNKITLNTIPGQKSEGILCTFKTLNILDNTPGIIELPEDAPIGQDFYDYLHLYDNIIDVDITPNRGDCLSIIGIAREIAAINRLKLKNFSRHTITPIINDSISIMVDAPDACPQYLTRIIKNINITISTPLWIREKLRRCGVSTVNIVTDITNYVLIELGHPIHIFDYAKISGNIMQIRYTKTTDTIVLSQNKILKLFPNTLIISDDKKILSLAGVISTQCSISSQTHHVVLQSAFFTPSVIAEQSRTYNIYTLSSIRYARGIDPNLSQAALERVTSLLLEYCHGCPGPIINVVHDNFLPKPKLITLHRKKLHKILGFYIKHQEITDILTRLGFQIQFSQQTNSWKILHPTWRFDISIEENIIAEIIRFYGYHKIPNPTIHTNLITPYHHPTTMPLSHIKSLLVARGYQEIITYSFVNPKIQKLLYPIINPVILKNPITLAMSSMRVSLWIGLIETMIYNQNRQQKHIKLFESGICFIPKDNNNHHEINQNFMIAGLRSGFRLNQHWDLTTYPVDFYDIKGDVEALLHLTNKFSYVRFKRSTHPSLHPIQNAAIYLNNCTCIGHIGVIHPLIQSALNVQSNILVFELEWNSISNITLPEISTISKFPKNYRDISIIVPNNISSESIINVCKKAVADKLIDIRLSDVYQNAKIPKNYKSLTIKLCLQSKTHTLREEEISGIINTCTIALQKNPTITVR